MIGKVEVVENKVPPSRPSSDNNTIIISIGNDVGHLLELGLQVGSVFLSGLKPSEGFHIYHSRI